MSNELLVGQNEKKDPFVALMEVRNKALPVLERKLQNLDDRLIVNTENPVGEQLVRDLEGALQSMRDVVMVLDSVMGMVVGDLGKVVQHCGLLKQQLDVNVIVLRTFELLLTEKGVCTAEDISKTFEQAVVEAQEVAKSKTNEQQENKSCCDQCSELPSDGCSCF